MHTKMKRALAGMAAIAVASTGLAISSSVAQAAPGDPSADTPPVTPTSGNSETVFTMPPRPSSLAANCAQDSATGQWRWNTFMVDASVNVNDINFGGSGPTLSSNPTAFLQPMWNTGGGSVINQFTAPTTGQIIGFPSYSFFVYPAGFVPAGDYKIGYACATQVGVVDSFYERIVRVTANTTPAGGAGQFTWTTDLSEAPAAPVIGAVNVAPTSATVNFTQTTAVPAVTGYTATVTPTNPAGPALAPIPVAPGATSFAVPGLTTGTEYSVSMIATNSVGDSPASNTVTFTPAVGAQPAIPLTYTAGVGGSGEATISWTEPTAVPPTGYTLTVAPAPAGTAPASYTIAAGVSSQVVTGLETGTVYTFTLQPAYTLPITGAASTVQGSVNPSAIIQQRITVTRPVGQLILTQRCGVNGDIPAFTGSDLVPGFPTDLNAIDATANQTGTSPDITPAAPGLPADAVTVDPEFDNYPFPSPATYPTECGIDLGTSTIVTTGDGAGLYFQADGFINEVTVTDTRDADSGWTLNGTMNDFIGINTPSNTFDGGWMGWVPQLQSNTANQTITTGPTVLPGTGILDANAGLDAGALLGSAPAGAGLGITEFDARLLLLIPTNVPTDDYVGLLDFTVA